MLGMADEAICIETPTKFARRTIAAGAVLPIGTIGKLNDANTLTASAASNDAFAGIVWVESTATDTFTEITVAMNGRWKFVTTGANIAVGVPGAIGGANQIRTAIAADLLRGDVVGNSLDTLVGAGSVVMDVGVQY